MFFQLGYDVFALLCIGWGNPDVEGQQEASIADVIAKPFTFEILSSEIARVLQQPAQTELTAQHQ